MCTHIGGALQVFNYDAHLSSRRRSGVEPQKKNSTSSIRSSHVQLCALCSSVFFPYNIREKTFTNREQRRHLTIRVHIYIYIEGYCKDTALVIEIWRDIVLTNWAGYVQLMMALGVSRAITKPPTRVRSKHVFIYLTINIYRQMKCNLKSQQFR